MHGTPFASWSTLMCLAPNLVKSRMNRPIYMPMTLANAMLILLRALEL